MERTVAICEFGGRTYELKPRTLEIQKKQMVLAKLSKDFLSGGLTLEEALQKQLDFIKATLENSPFDGIPMNELDIDDVAILCSRIIYGYNAKVTKGKTSCFCMSNSKGKQNKKKKKK